MIVPATAKVSLVVPIFNQGEFVEECLSSIASQSYQDFEVIIQDSLSQDETEKICRRYESRDSRFRYFREKDDGQSDAINRGLAKSRGIYWNWICSDDYYGNCEALGRLVEQLQSSNDQRVVGVHGDAHFVSEEGETLISFANEPRELTRDDFRMRWAVSQPACLFLRRAILEVGGVDRNLELGMDLDMVLKILNEDKRLRFVPSHIANVRLQPNAKSVKYQKRTALTALKILNQHFDENCITFESEFFREYLKATKDEVASKYSLYNLLKKHYSSDPPNVLLDEANVTSRGSTLDDKGDALIRRSRPLSVSRFIVHLVKKIVAVALLIHLRWKIDFKPWFKFSN